MTEKMISQIKDYIFKNFRYSKPDSVYDLMFLNHL
jgi:hypothetical protein